ncbi:lipase maturation factor family protein [Agromyces protaetiae]|uniref:Lipase maturation factor family protein n=1 Tax=Agromyces protaetiae TaxID=2509455 RepID=A0A4P6FN57_9MICO|nr:lipase maturation factor family protein [Agromyces protaetiae]QAY71958.1 lipase maturation factor family protein [Agromyces protaetiae]
MEAVAWLDWLNARDYWIAREILQRGVAAIAVIAFVSTLNQFRPLLGEHGLLPVPRLLAARGSGGARRLRGPSLFAWWGYSDPKLVAVAWAGIVLGASVVLGLPQLGPPWVPLIVFLVLWTLYLSIVVVGQTFYGFGWEMLLCEALFTVAFLGSAHEPPPLLVLIAVWWLVFRLEFGAGMIKIRGGREWRDLTALMFHHETQPMPGPLSRQAHLLPPWFHRCEVVANHVAQLVVPFLLFVPGPVASVAAAIIVLTQLWLIVTGNFAWLNWLTVVLAASAVSDSAWRWALGWLPAVPSALGSGARDASGIPLWWGIVVLAASALFLWLAIAPLRNLLARRQLMNASFNRYMLGNAYGAFGTVTKRRVEIVVAGTLAADPDSPEAEWREYAFRGKPGEVHRVPRWFAPYHLRLDWLMWFLPLGRFWEPWFETLLVRLLEADRPTLRLLAHDPFGGAPPVWVRVQAWHYRFSTRAEFHETHARWVRTLDFEVVEPMRLRD